MIKKHSFHIPVMGLAFTVDTPLKVAPYGMDSVVSISDDILIEKLRKMYCGKFKFPYEEISDKIEDFRAKRITSYLNLLKEVAEKKFDEIKNTAMEKGNELKKYFNMLPEDISIIGSDESKGQSWLDDHMSIGSIDVNIMTKLDRANFVKDEQLPIEFNDAHAALRGYANSDLSSSIVFSAGMNPRLFTYVEQFDDFYSNGNEAPKKKIILKVSDFRSAFVQGKFFAKKGLWVSEYRIESGLNCGGHAFATDGYLMGPILQEFKDRRGELIETVHELMVDALKKKDRTAPDKEFPLRITAQGGVGTAEEHSLLLNEYNLDSVGWGTPFLLVPEATSVDDSTIEKLIEAKEKDLYLSNISPLGVPFNNLRGNSKDVEKSAWIDQGRPGSSCPKKYLSLNTEFTEKPICTASRQYQHLKLKDLEEKNLSPEEFKKQELLVEDKSCICVGLGTSALLINDIDTKTEGKGVSICPGPNMAYFSKVMKLSEMTDHIYGRSNVDSVVRTDRPHMFVKELDIYIKYLQDKIADLIEPISDKVKQKQLDFADHLNDGIDYYTNMFLKLSSGLKESKDKVIRDLMNRKEAIKGVVSELVG